MRYELPEGHGLSADVVKELVFVEGGKPSLTEVQYEALSQGVARGESLLVVSPTSTGKTQIALWAITQSLRGGFNTVYLVTHRALAKQKFNEFKARLLTNFLDGDGASLVIATGDYVEDSNGASPASPLQAPLLVATYEKYLALLSAAGVPADMGRTVVVCDEMQLIGDEHRGQNVEVLLSLLRNAGWRQFVGLSAVLDSKDAADLANWLGVQLIVQREREKHLRYECWTPNGIAAVSTANPEKLENGIKMPNGTKLEVLSILTYLLTLKPAPLPIIVFCMRKQDTYQLSEAMVEEIERSGEPQLSLAFDALPETNANAFLARAVAQRIGVHNADLTEEEREIVEVHLANGSLDVVFATSTLAAGVNFPLGAAIFASWVRWDSALRQYVPIPQAEFHNMAGRVGRMGFDHAEGRAIFLATNQQEVRLSRAYLEQGDLTRLEPRILPSRFGQLALQLVASNICASADQVQGLVCSTYSALCEQDRNPKRYGTWPHAMSQGLEKLIAEGLVLRSASGKLTATPVGRAVGHSGLLPETGVYLLDYMKSKAVNLGGLLPTLAGGDLNRMAFLVFAACFSSPEFRGADGVSRTRYLPFPLEDRELFNADPYANDLPDPVWRADVGPINCAKLAVDWINGTGIRDLENGVKHLSAGMLREMYRNLIWVLQGLAAIVEADVSSPAPIGHEAQHSALKKLPRVIRRLSYRLTEGLPDDALWLTQLSHEGDRFKIGRHEILALRAEQMHRPQALMLGSPDADASRARAFSKAKPSPQAKANWVRDAARSWKADQRRNALERHKKRAGRCKNGAIVDRFYKSTGKEFESAFEEAISAIGLSLETLDDGSKTGAPDYVLKIPSCPPLIVELKSREGEKLVDYNKAVEVLAAAEVHGYKEAFCVTLCHPGVDPSVPVVIAACGRLSVVESQDLGEALIRICEGALTAEQFWKWLATPGQALSDDLPWREYPHGA